MERKWVAKPYRYADGNCWNENRYEIFYSTPDNKWVSVGGAMRTWKNGTVAFLADLPVNRQLRTPDQIVNNTMGLHVWGETLIQALSTLKKTFPDPRTVLEDHYGF